MFVGFWCFCQGCPIVPTPVNIDDSPPSGCPTGRPIGCPRTFGSNVRASMSLLSSVLCFPLSAGLEFRSAAASVRLDCPRPASYSLGIGTLYYGGYLNNLKQTKAPELPGLR